MISLQYVFLFMIVFFALIGYLRGWQREVIALSGLIASIAALMQFGDSLIRLVTALTGAAQSIDNPNALRQQEIWIQVIFHVTIAFFSYQVVARLADQVTGGRLGERLRGDLEKKILGMFIGAANGYLLVGSLWGFVEYQITANGYVQLPPEVGYPFDPNVIVRPVADASAAMITEFLPMGMFSPTVWLLLFFVSFFVVIIALI
jgi:uncharacterized membrane protein required for colicin V production